MDQRTPPGLDPDEIIDRITSELVALRLEHEQRIGRVLAQLHYYARKRDRGVRAGDGEVVPKAGGGRGR